MAKKTVTKPKPAKATRGFWLSYFDLRGNQVLRDYVERRVRVDAEGFPNLQDARSWLRGVYDHGDDTPQHDSLPGGLSADRFQGYVLIEDTMGYRAIQELRRPQ